MRRLFVVLTLPILFASTSAQTGSRMNSADILPVGYWPLEKSQPIIDKTQTIRLAPDLTQLSEGERKAVTKLLEVGKLFQNIYEEQRHKQAHWSYRNLDQLDENARSRDTQNLLTLYRL